MDYHDIIKNLKDFENGKPMVASHRGKFGSSVPENSALACEIAIAEGADMVEMDLAITKDGKFLNHHDSSLKRLLHRDGLVKDYTLQELQAMPYYNVYNEKCDEHTDDFAHVLKVLKGRTLLVLDRCWDNWEEAAAFVREEGMEDQVIFKCYTDHEPAMKWAEKHPEFMYIPMLLKTEDDARIFEMQKFCPVVGVEILPVHPDDQCLSPAYIDYLHGHNLKVWCNSLSLASRLVYGGGFTDLLSLKEGPDKGWGELLRRGVDIIQTDWPYEVKQYLLKHPKGV